MSFGSVLEFIFTVIIFKGIVLHYLTGWIDKGLHLWFGSSERKTAIYEHYKDRAMNDGHETDDVRDCHQGRCVVFNAV